MGHLGQQASHACPAHSTVGPSLRAMPPFGPRSVSTSHLADLAWAGGLTHDPGWTPCSGLAFRCCCCSGSTSQGFIMNQHNNVAHHLGDKCMSARSDIFPPCCLSPLSLPLPHPAEPGVQQMPPQQLGAFFQQLVDDSPLRRPLCVSVLLFAC